MSYGNNTLVTIGPFTHTVSSADPLLGQHAIHWALSREVYSTVRRKEIDGWFLAGGTIDTVLYHHPKDSDIPGRAIIAFRGSQSLYDIKQDVQLSRPGGNGCDFEKLKDAERMLEDFISENDDVEIQLTGHSLGGAIARCAGQKLGLGIVTFNSASPPSNPVTTGPNEVDYHIVFDLISAWQHPTIIRIDKGFRPNIYAKFDPRRFIDISVLPIFKSHSIDNFSNQKLGKVITANDENNLFFHWYNNLPSLAQKLLQVFTQTNRLPPIA